MAARPRARHPQPRPQARRRAPSTGWACREPGGRVRARPGAGRPRPRRRRRRVRLRRVGRRAPAGREGLRRPRYEAGRRFADDEHARTSWTCPATCGRPPGLVRHPAPPPPAGRVVLAGAGVGGGSLNYANTLYRPPSAFYAHGPWAGLADWEAELAPHYDTAERMLGVTRSTFHGPVEEAMRRTAEDLGVGSTFTHVPGGGVRPRRRCGRRDGCRPLLRRARARRGPRATAAGTAWSGAAAGAKNTLVKNYLHLAEAARARVELLRTVTRVEPLDPARPGSGWRVTTQRTGSPACPACAGWCAR